MRWTIRPRSLLEAAGNDVGAYNGPTGWVLPAAATFVIDHAASSVPRTCEAIGPSAEPADVLAVLDALA